MEPRVQAGVKLGKPKLLDQVPTVLRLKHYSLRTEQGYVDWIKRFILFDGTVAQRKLDMVILVNRGAG
jgi:integrase-like protein